MSEFVIKPCKVILEPCTPKAQVKLSVELRNVINERNILTARTKKKFISALDELEDDDKGLLKGNSKKYKEQAIEEIFQTEVKYLNQLETIMIYFMKPLRERNILSIEDYQCIFGGISNIYDVNGALLKELKEDSTKVAEAFCKMAPFFKLYSVYAYNYTTAMSKLQDVTVHNSTFSKFLDNQESRPEVQSKLSSLLITPIQRVPRYLLLLKQVADNTSPSESDFSILNECISQLETTANHINKQLDERENTQRLLELQKCLVQSKPNLIQANRKLVREGCLHKVHPQDSGNKEYYVILLSDILLWCKMRKSNLKAPKSLKCSAILPLHKCKVKFHSNTQYILLTYENDEFLFYHKNQTENEQWFDAINDTIKTEINNRQTLRKNSSARKAVFKRDVLQYHSPGLSPDKTRQKRQNSSNITDNKIMEQTQEEAVNYSPVIKKILKRKPIRSNIIQYEPPAKKKVTFKPERKDCLFPLREYIDKQNIINYENNDQSISKTVAPSDVFVFGDPVTQNNTGFRFRIGNVFTGIGESIKRFFKWN